MDRPDSPAASFFLGLPPNHDELRVGQQDPGHWVTYYHIYPAAHDQGLMIQYWHFFAYNDWQDVRGTNRADKHEGDWDAAVLVHVARDLHHIEDVAFSRHEDTFASPGATMRHVTPYQESPPAHRGPLPTSRNTVYTVDKTHPLEMIDSGAHASFASPADLCMYWQEHNHHDYGMQVWGDPRGPKAPEHLAEITCTQNEGKVDDPVRDHGGTVWDTSSYGRVTQGGSNIAIRVSGGQGGPLIDMGEYNPGGMKDCKTTCAGIPVGRFYEGEAGVFPKYSGLWGNPNSGRVQVVGFPPRGPVFQGYDYVKEHLYDSWFHGASYRKWKPHRCRRRSPDCLRPGRQ